MERNVTEKKARSGRFSYPGGKFGCYTSKYALRNIAGKASDIHEEGKFQKYLTALLILGVIFLNIKKVFMDFSVDVEYAITMSYRLAMGDHMFSQMREPHQTSAFLLAFFIKIWMSALGTTTGLVIYLNTVSLLIKSVIVLFFYKTLKRYCDREIALFMALFLAAAQAKTYILLDFSNMQVYSSVLLLCCLIRYLEASRSRVWLFLSALCLCLEVLSYPSCILVFFIVIALICGISNQRLKDCLLFSSVCGIMGITYITFFGCRLGWSYFFSCIGEILTGDSSHSVSLPMKFSCYVREIGQHLLLYGILAAVSLVITLLIRRLRQNKIADKKKLRSFYFISFFTLLGLFNLWSIISLGHVFQWVEFYPSLIILGAFLLSQCNETERCIFRLGVSLSAGCMFAVLLLTNLTLSTAIAYLIPGVAAAFIPIGHGIQALCRERLIPFAALMSLIFFRGFFLFLSISLGPQRIFTLGGIVKSGPAVGILSDYMGAYIMTCDLKEWPEHIQPGDCVLIVASTEAGTLKYLYEDVTICIDSTICTPTYNEKLLRYWEQNPDKFPDVVVVDCWFGHLNVDENSWIMQWIYEEFGADSYEDGTYQRYYRRQKNDTQIQ